MAFDATAYFPLEAKTEHATPVWQTTVAAMGGGTEVRNQWHSDTRHRFDVDLGIITLANFELLKKHFNGRRGRTRGFPYLSRSRFMATTEAFGTGDGSTVAFQLKIADGDAANAYQREIYFPISGTVQIYDNASLRTETTHYTINYSTGIVTFVTAPIAAHALTWTGQFRVPVRYDHDSIDDMELFMWVSGGVQLVSVGGLRLIETRDIS